MRFGGFFFWQLVRALYAGADENMALFGASVSNGNGDFSTRTAKECTGNGLLWRLGICFDSDLIWMVGV